ncbi:MAG: hypothetical protein ACQETI_01090 [Halobacteriota archaeon]
MNLRADRRGQALQVGAVLLLGIVVISMSVYQVTVVPTQNERVEFVHNQQVQGDMQHLRNGIVESATVGETRPVSVDLGTTYPSRTVFVNPPPPGGRLESVALGNVTVQNTRATNPETGQYWDGTTDRNVSTSAIQYEPSYSVYENAPTTVYENTALYNQFGTGRTLPMTSQALVDGRQIRLITVEGNLSAARSDPVSVDLRSVSRATDSIAVRGDGGNVTLVVPTRQNASEWRALLASERDPDGTPSNGRYLYAVNDGPRPNTVELVFESGATYELTMGKVGVGTGVEAANAQYLTADGETNLTVPEGTNRTLVVQARDRFNNPVSGVSVSAALTTPVGGDSVVPTTETTDEDGHARFTYVAPDDVDLPQQATVRTQFGPSADRRVSFDLTVTDADGSGEGSGGNGGGAGSDINPNSTDAVVLRGAQIQDTDCSNTDCAVDVTLKNLDSDGPQNVSQARFNFYGVDRQSSGNNQRPAPEEVVVDGTTLKAANEGGQYEQVGPIEIAANDTATVALVFYETPGTEFEVIQGDFFVFSVVFDNGRTATYFVAPETT